jgi:hypothetical protein
LTVCDKVDTPYDCQNIKDSIDDAYEQASSQEEAINQLLNSALYLITHDLSISNSTDPFKDPIVESHRENKWRTEWTTNIGNHIICEYSKTNNQLNYKIVEGPDQGVHRFFNYDTLHQGQTGVENFKKGHEGERKT